MSSTTVTRSGIGPELRASSLLAAPIVLGNLAMIGASVVDMVMAGHLGGSVLGAVAVGLNVWMVGLVGTAGLMQAISPSVAQLDGAGRRQEIGAFVRQALYLALAVGCVLGLLCYFGGPLLLRAMGVPAGLVAGGSEFLHAVAFMAPALALCLVCRGLCEGLSLPGLPMAVNLLGLPVLAGISYLLMYQLDMGAFGSGLATSVVSWLQFGVYAVAILRGRDYRRLGWGGGRYGPDVAVLAGLLRLSLPMAFSSVMEVGMFSAAALAVGRFGETAVAGHQIAINVASVSFMVPMGISAAVTVRVGRAIGGGDRAGARLAGLVGMAMAVACQAVACGLMLAIPGAIVGLYTSDPAVVAVALGLLFLAALFQLSDGLQVACIGALRGMKDARVPMVITMLAYWGVGMPVGLLLAFPLGMGTPGMWVGLVAGLTVAAGLFFGRFMSRTS